MPDRLLVVFSRGVSMVLGAVACPGFLLVGGVADVGREDGRGVCTELLEMIVLLPEYAGWVMLRDPLELGRSGCPSLFGLCRFPSA